MTPHYHTWINYASKPNNDLGFNNLTAFSFSRVPKWQKYGTNPAKDESAIIELPTVRRSEGLVHLLYRCWCVVIPRAQLLNRNPVLDTKSILFWNTWTSFEVLGVRFGFANGFAPLDYIIQFLLTIMTIFSSI